ncbi:methylthioribulose 1-phosphate dehydratase [Sphingomonas sp. FW199]|uniref:methylthioribulose 1-phosphate dehydratase n=1 Tax=Sphingomonas sp. FW199 TaxID=3400217 RepID=UPI003CEDCC02
MSMTAQKPDTAEAAIAALIAATARLDARGLAAATSGNHSVRLDAETIAITRSGTHKGRLTPADLMLATPEGEPLEPGRPSAETVLHALIYRQFPDAGAILHWHSPGGVALSRTLGDALVLTGHEMLKAYPGVETHDTERVIPVVDNSQDMGEIEAALGGRLTAEDTAPVFMIRAHGIYGWGRDVAEAERVAEATEFMIAAEIAALTISGARP